ARDRMLGADLYLCCVDGETGQLVPGTTSCQMCKRLVINAGIERVIVRNTEEEYTVFQVSDWVDNDDSLGTIGY
ncbi:MAG: cytidine deaminase, partial [Clostridia bacterium]|nr:cytidine deaminase [Clostridia bacterium]